MHHDAAVHATRLAPPPRCGASAARLSGVSGIGVVPQVGLGAEVALTLPCHRSTLAEIGETSWLATVRVPRFTSVRRRISTSASTSRRRAVSAGVRKIPLRAWGTAEVGLRCRARARRSRPARAGGSQPAPAFGVAWQMTRWFCLVGSTEVLGAFDRVRFSLGDGVVLFAPAPVSARATCGIEVGWQ